MMHSCTWGLRCGLWRTSVSSALARKLFGKYLETFFPCGAILGEMDTEDHSLNSERISLFAPCGMDCALCQAYQGMGLPCSGCRIGSSRKACLGCPIKACLKKDSYCFECEKYPCPRLRRLDARYKNRYGMSMLENLSIIKEQGPDALIRVQEEKHRCPVCGNLKTVHKTFCIHCMKRK